MMIPLFLRLIFMLRRILVLWGWYLWLANTES